MRLGLQAWARAKAQAWVIDGRLILLVQSALLAALTRKSGEAPLTPQQRVV